MRPLRHANCPSGSSRICGAVGAAVLRPYKGLPSRHDEGGFWLGGSVC